jgi:prepilin-type N-terminal cleavage/methylation domain-containing protein
MSKSPYISVAKRKGFTLAEILMVMMITSILVLGINTAFRQAHQLYSKIHNDRDIYQNTRMFFDTLDDELSCLYIMKTDNEQPPLFVLSQTPEGNIQLTFLTVNPVWGHTALSNLPAKVSYEFQNDEEIGLWKLFRSEQLYAGEKAVAAENKEIILEGFSGAAVQAADKRADSFDECWKDNLSCNQLPPAAVRIIIKWPIGYKKDVRFETVIYIPCSVNLK